MSPESRFLIFIAVSLLAFAGVLLFTLRRREKRPGWTVLLTVVLAVVVGGMTFAKWGATVGLPWWIYYSAPAAATLVLPPVVFRMKVSEIVEYLVLALLMAPGIHTVFSLLLGWKEYMPFLPVPSISELIQGVV